MNLAGLIFSLLNAKTVPNLARRGPSPAQQREIVRIVAYRTGNWPNRVPLPRSQAHYLPLLRKGGGQQETGT